MRILLTLASTLLAIGVITPSHASPVHDLEARGDPGCRNYNTNFATSMSGWVASSGKKLYQQTSQGLELKLTRPKSYKRKIDKDTKLPYNTVAGNGPTFNVTGYMQYGEFSADLKTAQPGGAVTAVIVIADGGDEIDFEIVGGVAHQAQSNYFYGKDIVYGVNGGVHTVPGGAVYDSFHTYGVKWTPSEIQWSIDGKVVRTKTRTSTCKKNVCQYPTHPARLQIGLWDGSTDPGTAQWANGPIDWTKYEEITAVVKNAQLHCSY